MFSNRKISRPNQKESDFLKRYPEFAKTQFIDEIRKKDFARLDEQNHTYLDYTGGNLYGLSQLEKHQKFLSQNILGNPHSINPSSSLAEHHVHETRSFVLDFFKAKDDYECIFTSNASGALKIIGECYPFEEDGQLLLSTDNHNSVNGIREHARAQDCPFEYVPLNNDLRLDDTTLEQKLREKVGHHKLFAFPAQSNVSGVKHNLNWISRAQNQGWDVLLDAAAFVPSDTLDLSLFQPEFVSISFYKIFGYPTGIGALLIKKSAYNKLVKASFTGGTISIVSVKGDGHYLLDQAARFEDGTINYLEIPAIKTGLSYIQKIGMNLITTRVQCLTGHLLDELQRLRHDNGDPLIHIYGPKTVENRGGTIAMNFYDVNDELYDFTAIEKAAYKENISIRTGCFCNPGIDETNHSLVKEDLITYFNRPGKKDYFDLIDFLGTKRGAVRVSLGYITNLKDLNRFLDFCKGFLNQKIETRKELSTNSIIEA